ncbi:hypothetical protein PIB30_109490, partial [Stylosanthes scabra]|nr:hypothetical protein [Stylosanthes scabra]
PNLDLGLHNPSKAYPSKILLEKRENTSSRPDLITKYVTEKRTGNHHTSELLELTDHCSHHHHLQV